MPRKLNWNRSLIVSDTGVKEVVRDLVGRNVNNQEDAGFQSVDAQSVNSANPPIDRSGNQVNNQPANTMLNSAEITTGKKPINKPANSSKIPPSNQPRNQIEDSVVDSTINTTAFSSTDSTSIMAMDQPKMSSMDSANIATVDTPFNRLPFPSKNNSINTTTKRKAESVNNSTTTTTTSSLASMAEWHTESEQKVYAAMYNETIAHRRKERFFTAQGLCEQTGIASQTTIRTAIQGLIEKKSIEVIERKGGGRLAVRYRVYGPVEIVARRRKGKMKIDEQTKKII